MADTQLRYVDLSGEKGKMTFKGRTIAMAALETAIAPLSYCGFPKSVLLTATAGTAKLAPDGLITDGFNDKDVKCILTFLDTTNDDAVVRVAVPAPKIDVASGIATVKVGGKRQVPAVKAAGALGNDGGELAALMATMMGYGAGELVFSSGSFTKSAS